MPTILYNVQLIDVFTPSSNIHYIAGGGFAQGVIISRNLENIIQMGVQNRGILKAKDVTLSVTDCPSCIDISIKPEKADIFPKSTYYYEVKINTKCDPGTYKIKFKVEGNNIFQEEELEFTLE
jgi:uncharacterized membrane protein